MRVLNLYAGIGGNREKWPEHWQVTAVEWDARIAAVYQARFPHDLVIGGSAAPAEWASTVAEYDFVWASPPCQTHSRASVAVRRGLVDRDPQLEDWVDLLSSSSVPAWVVENVYPAHELRVPPHFYFGRHAYWTSNRRPPALTVPRRRGSHTMRLTVPPELHGLTPNTRQVIRNACDPTESMIIAGAALDYDVLFSVG